MEGGKNFLSRPSPATSRTTISKQVWAKDNGGGFGDTGVASTTRSLATLQNTPLIIGSEEGQREAFQVMIYYIYHVLNLQGNNTH